MATRIKRHAGVQGVKLPGGETLLDVRYADDMQVVVLSSTLDALLLVIQQWCDETGMALHPLKTEGMWIGRRRNDIAVLVTYFGGKR